MNKLSLRKIMSAVAVAATITTLSPLGVSAQWRQNTDSTWSYTEGNNMASGWKNIFDAWYYFNSDGKMNTSWILDNGNWYYLDTNGAMKTGWIEDNGKWYYADITGVMQTGVVKINEKIYCLNNSGEMQVGSVNIGNKVCKFSSNGQAVETISQWSKEFNSIGTGTTATNTIIDIVNVNKLPTLPQTYDISVQVVAENQIIELMNQKRGEAGLQLLTIDSTLLQVARYKSDHMIQYNYFDHTTPEKTKWTDWLKAIDYKYTTTGENIAYNTYDAVELFNQWWNSSGHRANMMNASYTKVGIGVIYGNGKYMGTQEFSN